MTEARTEAEINELLTAYRRQAVLHGEASEKYDARRGNAAHDRLTRVRQQLREAGSESHRRVLAFLDDEHPAVRCWAAVDALDLSPDDGLRVLKELAEGPKSEVRFNARMILKMWDAGEWPPDSR